MRSRKITMYYCEHCKKKGCSRFYMARHEKGCTLNPGRACGVCGDSKPTSIVELAFVARFGVDELRRKTEGCPACMLAGVRARMRQIMKDLTTFTSAGQNPERDALDAELEKLAAWSYRDERAVWWSAVNDESGGWHSVG